MYESLFEPMKIGSLEIKNRFVMPAMNSHYGDREHYFTKQAVRYYTERAKGEFGLLITEFLCVSEEGLASSTQAGIYDDKFTIMLKELTTSIHQNESVIFAQLQHSGRVQAQGVTKLPAVGASSVPDPHIPIKIHELTTQEVKQMIEKFVDAAKRAKQAGFDGVEIHGAHGYLLAQFLSKGVNKRVDQYGGNITNRARIVCEVIQRIKEECGSDYPVIVRTSGDEAYFGGNTIEDAMVHARLFEEAGADAIHVSHGIPIHPYYTSSGFNIENAKKVKNAISIPVIGVGRINDPSLALNIIETKSADFVALGRQSICDPHFPLKVKENRIDEIFTCTGCMQRCLYSSSFEEGYGTSCMINPFSGKEGQWIIEPTDHKKRIGVVGAGPAGLQAAWILQERGHDVTLYEKNATVGGQYRLASVPPMKQDLAKTISTYLTLCNKYGVNIICNCTVTKDLLDKENYDEILITTGSLPIIPHVEGIKNENVYLANDILSFEKMMTNKKVLVLGAGLVGAETSEVLSEYQNSVTIVDMLDSIAPLAPYAPRKMMLKHLEESGVNSILNSKVIQIHHDGVDIEKDGQRLSLQGYDAIVLAFGSKSNHELYQEIKEYKNIYLLGDALHAGDAKKAIFEATEFALKL